MEKQACGHGGIGVEWVRGYRRTRLWQICEVEYGLVPTTGDLPPRKSSLAPQAELVPVSLLTPAPPVL
jgi:hypothetical protein